MIKEAFRVCALLLVPVAAWGDEARDLQEAISALARTSYAWETTARQRFSGESTEPRLNLNAPAEVRGRFDPRAFTEITLLPGRDVPVAVTAVFSMGDVVALTPNGWQRRSELRQLPGGDKEVEFQGKKVRLARVLSTALRATAMRPLTEELFDLTAELKSVRSESGLIVAELREATVEQMWGDAQARRAPEIQGTVIFKTGEDGLAEYHVVLAIGFPNSRTKKTGWSMQQWSTRITGIGATVVEPAEAAVKALEN